MIYFTKKSIFEWYKKTKSQYKKDEFLKIYIDYPKENWSIKFQKSRSNDKRWGCRRG